MMYKQVEKMTPVARIYEQELLDNGTTNPEQVARMKKKINDKLEEAYQKSKTYSFKAEDWVTQEWQEVIEQNLDKDSAKLSGVDKSALEEVGSTITTLPAEKNFHRLVRKIFEARKLSIESGKGIDWGTAEALAFATLIKEGYDVRISG